MPADDTSDQLLLEQARDRARLLLEAVGGDLDAMRAAASDAAYADGAALCEEVAGAVGQLLDQIDAELLAASAAVAAEKSPEIHPASENPPAMTETAPAAPAPADHAGEIVAKPDTWYRRKWLLIGLAALGWGWYSLYDGYISYPRQNQEAIDEALRQGKPEPEKLPHGGYDIPLNRLIGWSLQPLGAFILIWGWYSSRGVYRFSGDTLHAPGHPPVPIDAIRAIDESKWDRKGIAYIDYEVNGATGRIKLDDYAYQREPTDQIHDRILAAVAPEEASAIRSPATGENRSA